MAYDTGSRSFYLNDFSDESVPCEPSLAGWAEWLSKPDSNWHRDTEAKDGETFSASATVWQDDIIATCSDGEWSLSRQPLPNAFVAARFGAGLGWSAEDILDSDEAAILEYLKDYASDDGEVYLAIGTHESGWRVTYTANPPTCVAERTE